jgi:hypothetical protein
VAIRIHPAIAITPAFASCCPLCLLRAPPAADPARRADAVHGERLALVQMLGDVAVPARF